MFIKKIEEAISAKDLIKEMEFDLEFIKKWSKGNDYDEGKIDGAVMVLERYIEELKR